MLTRSRTSSSAIERPPEKKKARVKGGILGGSEFISPLVVQYLGTRSLLRFSSTNTQNKSIVSNEISRRKKRIEEIKIRIPELLRGQIPSKRGMSRLDKPLRRADVLEARRLCDEVKRLIDSELVWFDCSGTEDNYNAYFGFPRRRRIDRLFAKERKLLSKDQSPGPLYMLPLCFYVPLVGEPREELPGEQVLDEMFQKAGQVWGAEDHMSFCFEMYEDEIMEKDAEGEVFWKYGLDAASSFSYFMWDVAHKVVKSSSPHEHLEGLRVGARRCALNWPNSRDCQHYTLILSDLFVLAHDCASEHIDRNAKDKQGAIDEFMSVLEEMVGFQIDPSMKGKIGIYLEQHKKVFGDD